MKKLAFIFILIFVCLLPCASFAEGIFSYSFETPLEDTYWSGGVFDGSNYFEQTGYPLYVNNPFGEVKGDLVTHVLDYMQTVTLEGGKVYNISGYVFNPLSAYSPSVRSSATSDRGTNNIILSVSGIGDEWAKFSSTFYIGESGEYKLSVHFADGHTDFGFFADEFTLSEVDCTISSISIFGQDEILIPAIGSVTSYYRPYLLTSENQSIDILSPGDIHFSVGGADGVSFNHQDFSLTVTSSAKASTGVFIDCALRNHELLAPTSLYVEFTDNMIDDSALDGEELMWTSSSDLSHIEKDGNRFISVPTNDYGDFGYFSTINYASSQILMKDSLYVVRARVKSDGSKSLSAVHAKNSAEVKGNTVFFSIKDISGEGWYEVFAAFVPEQSGIYDIAINLCSMSDCTIFIDDVTLSCESADAEYITLHAPGNIAVPSVTTKYPVSALLRDQLGNAISSDNVKIRLLNQNPSLYLDEENNLVVHPDAPAGEYTLYAIYFTDPSITAKLDFTVSYDFIGDGGFENTIPNEWWMVASPFDCDFYMRHDGYGRRALVNCRGSYFMLLNNSYIHLIKDTPYVFNSSFAVPTDCTGTLFIETLDGAVLPLVQFLIPAGITLDEKLPPELFLAEEDAVGRIFLYVESDNGEPFSVYTDNLSLKSASIMAITPRISGTPHINGAADAEFILYNSIAENDDPSACVINWYVSDTIHGKYEELPYSGKSIYFDTTFLNKYVYFEVVPICPMTGFSGEAAHSAPMLITYQTENESSLPMYSSIINWEKPNKNYFEDSLSHWASEYICTLAHSGVVSGRNDTTFAPDETVTRGEFAKMLSVAFSINTVSDDFAVFTDISKDDWYYPNVTALYLAGIVNGTSETTFSPNEILTREQAVTQIIRVYEKAVSTTAPMSENNFTDESLISPWAKISVRKAARLKIATGFPDGSFAPQEPLTRAQAAVIIYNLASVLKK